MHIKSNRLLLIALVFLVCLSAPPAAHADAMIPVGWIIWPMASWIALIFIIIIEAWIARRILGLKRRTALLRSGLANVASAIVGIPFSWGLFLVLERTTAELGCLPYGYAFNWVVPSVGIVLLIPFFYISVFVERWAFDVKRKLDKSQVRLWSWKANLVTYGIILFLMVCTLISGIVATCVGVDPVVLLVKFIKFVIDAIGALLDFDK